MQSRYDNNIILALSPNRMQYKLCHKGHGQSARKQLPDDLSVEPEYYKDQQGDSPYAHDRNACYHFVTDRKTVSEFDGAFLLSLFLCLQFVMGIHETVDRHAEHIRDISENGGIGSRFRTLPFGDGFVGIIDLLREFGLLHSGFGSEFDYIVRNDLFNVVHQQTSGYRKFIILSF